MNVTSFKDLSKEYTVMPIQAAEQIETLFHPMDYISISGKRVNAGPNKVLTQFIQVKDFVESMRSNDGYTVLQDLCFNPEPMDLYFGLGTVNKNGYRGPLKRVREVDIQEVRVLYADLDVKPGSFKSSEEAYTWLSDLCLKYKVPPAYITNSGSGGLHVYWKLKQPIGNIINAKAGKELAVMWWSWLQDNAPGIHIDKLVDMARMSRVAGTIHWPKEPGESVGLVRGFEPMPLNIIDPVYVLDLCKESYDNLRARRKKIRDFEQKAKESSLILPNDIDLELSSDSYLSLFIKANIEPYVNEYISWDSILGDAGWTFLREDAEGRREWARPGRSTKSAVVDWPESPNTMSLMSTSIETGLSDLLDAGVPLTKWRVFVRIYFRDNFEEAATWIAKEMLKTL
jgi:hypothetical protein